MTAVAVLTTVGPGDDALALARALVELRVAACVNVIEGVTSVYRWEGAVHEDGERLLLIKTTTSQLEALEAALLARHPYQLPEFVVLPVTATSEAYGAWLEASTTPEAR